VLELVLESGEIARVRVTLTGGETPSPTPLPLGVAVPALTGTVRRRGVTLPLVDWLVEVRPAWVAVAPRPDGGPRLALRDSRELWRRAGISTMYMVATTGTPQATAWTKELDQLDASAPGQVALGVEPEWLETALETGEQQRTLQTVAAWRDATSRRTPALELVVPMPTSFVGRLLQEKVEVVWGRTLRSVDSVEILPGRDAPFWSRVWDSLKPRFEGAGVTPTVRWVWVPRDARRNLGFELPPDRSTLATAFLIARARFPGSRVVVHLADLTRGQDRELTAAWHELERVARRVDGLTFQRDVIDTAAGPPRLDSPDGTMGVTFSGGGRRVQLLFARSPAIARFQPPRPGTLLANGTEPPWSAPRVLLDTAPVELAPTDGTIVYEELIPVMARPADGLPVQVTTGESR
jgi:hypothetical protein